MKRSLAFHCSLFLWERLGERLIGAQSKFLIPSLLPKGEGRKKV